MADIIFFAKEDNLYFLKHKNKFYDLYDGREFIAEPITFEAVKIYYTRKKDINKGAVAVGVPLESVTLWHPKSDRFFTPELFTYFPGGVIIHPRDSFLLPYELKFKGLES